MNQIRKYTFFLLIILAFPVSGSEDFSNLDPVISDKYIRGKIAIYDCGDQHLVCATASSIQVCDVLGVCGVIKEFASNKKCEDFVLSLVSSNYSGDFCKAN